MKFGESKIQIGWKKTRTGPWAGRGFHIQHLFSTLLLVRQWAGIEAVGYLVPEGLEDCVVETTDREYWIQVKSRKHGVFGESEIRKIVDLTKSKVEKYATKKTINIIVALEQSSEDNLFSYDDKILNTDEQKIIYFGSIGKEILNLLVNKLGLAEVLAEGIADSLYKLVVEASEANADLSFDKRRKISISEVESLIQNRLISLDSSLIDQAYEDGLLKPVNFNLTITEPSFYQGVKVSSGHVAAGLVIERPSDVVEISNKLLDRLHVLITGPSGAGKSALLWLSATHLAGEIRWKQITGKALFADADKIVRYVRARHPSSDSPIGLIFDEINSANSGLWDILVIELRSIPFVHLLGSIRQEDAGLIASSSDTEFQQIKLNPELAESVWKAMNKQKQTHLIHWKEAYEQSNGLMLEYTHLLTKGKRLVAVIDEQVQERMSENRLNELDIIRCTSVLCMHGGEIDTKKLFLSLEMSPIDASIAMRRLLDEHLIRESSPGIIGGLHSLRSDALANASHDGLTFFREDSLWKSLRSVTPATVPRLIQSILSKCDVNSERLVLKNLSNALGESDDINTWIAIFTGLGLATLERNVIKFIEIMKKYNLERAHWYIASSFIDPGIEIPVLAEYENWQKLRNAVLEFRKIEKYDFRSDYIQQLSEQCVMPTCKSIVEYTKLLSTLVPIACGNAISLNFSCDIETNGELEIREVSDLLSVAFYVKPEIVVDLVEGFGGEEVLFTWFHNQVSWTTMPVIEVDEENNRVVRSDWCYVAKPFQENLNDSLGEICETLITLSPNSKFAASKAVDPLGKQIPSGYNNGWEKNIPRANVFADVRVAWNIAFRQILLKNTVTISLTDYTQQMSLLIRRTDKAFRKYTEKWITSKKIPNKSHLAFEMNDIMEIANSLAYAPPEIPESNMDSPVIGGGVSPNTVGSLITSILGNLVKRMAGIKSKEGVTGMASFAAKLSEQAINHRASDIWRTTASPPMNELLSISRRLNEVSCILHELSHSYGDNIIYKIYLTGKSAKLGNAVKTVRILCEKAANIRLQLMIDRTELSLKQLGWVVKCWTKPIDKKDSPYWPARDIAILVEVLDIDAESDYISDVFKVGRENFIDCSIFSVVPVIYGQVLPTLAVSPSSTIKEHLPNKEFGKNWEQFIPIPFIYSKFADKFEKAMASCIYLSRISAFRNIENLNNEEESVFLASLKLFNESSNFLIESAEKNESENLLFALELIEDTFNSVCEEIKNNENGEKINDPVFLNAHSSVDGDINEGNLEMGFLKIALLIDECVSRAE